MRKEAAQTMTSNYAALDQPEILRFLFYPRKEWDHGPSGLFAQDLMIPVENDTVVGARFHLAGPEAPNILYFHGNGEIVADYDDLAEIYNDRGLNFLPVDYRGYGRSTGTPTVSSMLRDAGVIFEFVVRFLNRKQYNGPIIVMGRSLGSASALELAASHAQAINGLIIESGFADTTALLRTLGVDTHTIGFTETRGMGNLDKIHNFQGPILIIHAEFDHIIPYSDGQALFDSCTAPDKTLLKIPGANHNDIFQHGLEAYMDAISTLAEKAKQNAGR